MEKPEFVCVTYVATSPEKVWQALVDTEITRKYWYHVNVSDWKPGSRWEHRHSDRSGALRLVGTVLESVPPRRLVLTWAYPQDEAHEERHTRVTFEIEPVKGVVRLTVTHDRFAPGSDMLEKIRVGWPKVLASLKSLLETGQPLPELW